MRIDLKKIRQIIFKYTAKPGQKWICYDGSIVNVETYMHGSIRNYWLVDHVNESAWVIDLMGCPIDKNNTCDMPTIKCRLRVATHPEYFL